MALLRILLASLSVAACGGGPGGPSSTPSPVALASAPATTSVGGVSISSILGAASPPPSTSWLRVVDPGAPFSYEVPSAWTMHAANPWQEAGTTIGTALAAGPDLSKLSTDFSVPGIVLGVSANPSGITPRQIVEAGGSFEGICTPSAVQEATDSGATAVYQLWASCGGTGVLLVMALTAAGQQGLIGIVYQGTSPADLGYLDHIVGSVAPSTKPAASGPPATAGSGISGPTYTISMDVCQNQHGQGVSGGLIRNDDSLIHSYRIVVAFSDPNGVFLNDTGWTTSDLQPGVTAQWQATVPSGLPAVSVSCQITRVELVR